MQDTETSVSAQMAWAAGGIELDVHCTDSGVSSVRFVDARQLPARTHPPCTSDLLRETCRELSAYFEGRLREFSVPIDLRVGTAFQRAVWDRVCAIPYGATASYSDIAAAVGNPAAVRAVGSANGRNPVPILIPCHRVIERGGGLGGYGGGLPVKRALLQLEAVNSNLFAAAAMRR